MADGVIGGVRRSTDRPNSIRRSSGRGAEGVDAGVLKRAASESETMRVALVRQEHVLAAQTQQVAACDARHELEERLSRGYCSPAIC